jgi:hypothetical protein
MHYRPRIGSSRQAVSTPAPHGRYVVIFAPRRRERICRLADFGSAASYVTFAVQV